MNLEWGRRAFLFEMQKGPGSTGRPCVDARGWRVRQIKNRGSSLRQIGATLGTLSNIPDSYLPTPDLRAERHCAWISDRWGSKGFPNKFRLSEPFSGKFGGKKGGVTRERLGPIGRKRRTACGGRGSRGGRHRSGTAAGHGACHRGTCVGQTGGECRFNLHGGAKRSGWALSVNGGQLVHGWTSCAFDLFTSVHV